MPRLKKSQVWPACYYYLRMILKADEHDIWEAMELLVLETWQIEELALLGEENKHMYPTVWDVVMEH